MTQTQAWREFEKAVAKIESIEEAAKWLRENPKVAAKMTGIGLLRCFDEDMKKGVDTKIGR
jgi:hypothetical protein